MNAITLKLIRRNPNALKPLRVRYHVLRHDAAAGYTTHEHLPAITLDGGKLTVGNLPILNPRFTANHITWIQQSPGRYSSGHIYVHDRGLSIHGVVNRGTSRDDAVTHHFIGTAVKPVVYKTRITRKAFPRGQDPQSIPDAEWQDGFDLRLSFELKVGDAVPHPAVTLGGHDITEYCTWKTAANGNTVLQLALDDSACDLLGPQFYREATLAFDPYIPAPAGSGDVSALCGAEKAAPGLHFWKAAPVTAQFHSEIALEHITPADLGAPLGALNVDELMTILPNQAVSDGANDRLIRNMKWAMGQDSTETGWLSDLLGELPPTLTDSESAPVKKNLDWYQSFAKAYLTNAFQKYNGPHGADQHRLTAEQAKKLDDYLRTGLAASKGFNAAHQANYVASFCAGHPELNSYLNDGPDGGEKWAKALHERLTGGQQFTLAVESMTKGAKDPQATVPVTNFATLLGVLQPSGALASSYHRSILVGVVNKFTSKAVHSDEQAINELLPYAIQAMLEHLASRSVSSEAPITQQQTNVSSEAPITQQQAKDALAIFIKEKQQIVSAIAKLLVGTKANSLIQQLELAAPQFAKVLAQWPKFAAAAKGMFVVGWSLAFALIVWTLVRGDWKKMTPVQKGQFVTECTRSVLQAADAAPLLYAGIKSITAEAFVKFFGRLNAPEGQVQTIKTMESISEGADAVESAATELVDGQAAQASAWSRVFTVYQGALQVFAVIIAIAMVGLSAWQVAEDFMHNADIPTKVLDTLMLATNTLLAGFGIAGLVLPFLDMASEFCPIASAVLAMIGMILTLISLLLDHVLPNPVDDFMRDVGQPYVDALPKPLPPPDVKLSRVAA